MTPSAAASSFYVTGGTMPPTAPSYVVRAADEELYKSVMAGEYCHVLTSRQMGKSSLMARTARRLRGEGVAVAILDMTTLGTERSDAERWYYTAVRAIHGQIAPGFEFDGWWERERKSTAVHRFTRYLEEAVAAVGKPIVIFLDEIDSTLALPFSDDFFAAIRSCYNARATDERWRALTFVLLGVATPAQLIRDPSRTPYNIGREITLEDFTRQEAATLAELLGADEPRRRELLDRILGWTGGHPYLTQVLCRELVARGGDSDVDEMVGELFLQESKRRTESNLKVTGDRLLQGGRPLLALYKRILSGKDVLDEPTSPLHLRLKLTGAVKVDERGRLRVRNRVYERVFDEAWLRETMPVAAVPWIVAVALVFVAAAGVFAYRARQSQLAAEAKLWDRGAIEAMSLNRRDDALLYWLRALTKEDTADRRKQAHDLVRSSPQQREILRTLNLDSAADFVSFSPDGRFVIVSDAYGEGRIWVLRTGQFKDCTLPNFEHITAIALSLDATNLIASRAGPQNAFVTWNLSTERPTAAVHPSKDAEGVWALGFGPEGSIVSAKGGLMPLLMLEGLVYFGRSTSRVPLFEPLPRLVLRRGVVVGGLSLHRDGTILIATQGFYNFFGDAGTSRPDTVRAVPENTRAIRFGPDCDKCVDAAVVAAPNRLEIVRLYPDLRNVPPIEGDPEELLAQWQQKLGLEFDPAGGIRKRQEKQ